MCITCFKQKQAKNTKNRAIIESKSITKIKKGYLMNLPSNWKTIAGWACLLLSVCCTATYLTLPFSGFAGQTIVTGVAIAMIMGKILFASAIYFLGKKYVDQLKNRLLGRKKTEDAPSFGDNDK
jgi:membrane-anchored glycerophosphoryl diester phosphodiesterase (GDPDase)